MQENEVLIEEPFDRLVWNEEFEWWEGRVSITPCLNVSISISEEQGADDCGRIAQLLRAKSVVELLSEREEEARYAAADELLPLFNAEWNRDAAMDEAEFMRRLKLIDVHVDCGGTTELYYSDDNLFEGHTLIVYLSAEGNFVEADLAG